MTEQMKNLAIILTLFIIGCGTEAEVPGLKEGQADVTLSVIDAGLFPTGDGTASKVRVTEVHDTLVELPEDDFILFHSDNANGRVIIEKKNGLWFLISRL
jgi:hypothetical protein